MRRTEGGHNSRRFSGTLYNWLELQIAQIQRFIVGRRHDYDFVRRGPKLGLSGVEGFSGPARDFDRKLVGPRWDVVNAEGSVSIENRREFAHRKLEGFTFLR